MSYLSEKGDPIVHNDADEGFSLAREAWGRTFKESFPARVFFFLFLFFFFSGFFFFSFLFFPKVKISWGAPISLLRQDQSSQRLVRLRRLWTNIP